MVEEAGESTRPSPRTILDHLEVYRGKKRVYFLVRSTCIATACNGVLRLRGI